MSRKTVLWIILLLCLGGLAYGVYHWNQHRTSAWRNRARAKRVCQKYREQFKRECKVVRGLTCGKSWYAIKTFKYPTFLACRREVRNEGFKKAKNTLNVINPLVNAYKIYMAHIAKDRWMMHLPPKLRKLYQPHFRVPLKNILVGRSKLLKTSGITDCDKMFFRPEMHMIRQIKAGIFSSKENELFFLHELTHAEQCFKAGGRNNYANMWFSHLRKSVIRNILKGKELNSENIHAQQPMEKKAERKAIKVQQQTNNHWTR